MDAGGFFIATSARDMSVPRHFRALAAELAARGRRVVVLVDGQRSDVVDQRTNPSTLTWPSLRPTAVRDAVFLYQLIREYRPACLIANFGSTNLMMAGGAALSVPCRVCWYHTLSAQVDSDSRRSSCALKLLRLRKRLVYRAATHIVPVSHAAAADLCHAFQVPRRKLRVFHNAVADPLDGSAPQPQRCRRRDLLCAGRLYPTKGQDVLLRALALLKPRFPDCRVRFVGEGPDRLRYEALARELGVEGNCEFVGELPADQVTTLMASAAATVVPSRIDNCPLVIIESLAVGTPVVASAVGGIVELVRDGREGFLVPSGDPVALAGRLRMLLDDGDGAASIGLRARKRFETDFEQRRVILQQADWLEELATASVRRSNGRSHRTRSRRSRCLPTSRFARSSVQPVVSTRSPSR